MYQLREDKRRAWFRSSLADYFRMYEAKMYFKPMQQRVEEQLVTHYMRKPDYDKQYTNLLNTQRKIEEKLYLKNGNR